MQTTANFLQPRIGSAILSNYKNFFVFLVWIQESNLKKVFISYHYETSNFGYQKSS